MRSMTSPRPTEVQPAVDPVRSRIMRAVRQKDTKPEKIVRQALHAMGLRFRLHRRDLPGTPDIVLSSGRKVAIFVHGCFWHRHSGCRSATMPATRQSYWGPKFVQNVERDAQKVAALEALGWSVLTIWECETRSEADVEATPGDGARAAARQNSGEQPPSS